MRIIAGDYKGRKLITPNGADLVRPHFTCFRQFQESGSPVVFIGFANKETVLFQLLKCN